MKKPQLNFDNHISNIDELLIQLKSLKEEAFINMRSFPNDYRDYREIFIKDFYALKITINYLEEMKLNGKM